MRYVLLLAISTVALLVLASCDRPGEAVAHTSRNPPSAPPAASASAIPVTATAPDAPTSSTLVAASARTPHDSTDARTSRALEAAGFRRYGLGSGVVEYRVSGALSGRELVYFDRFGLREARYTETFLPVLDRTETSRELTLIDGAWVTSVDLADRTGLRALDPTFDGLAGSRDRRDLTVIAETTLRQMGGRRTGSEMLLGQECDVWELPAAGGRAWVWNGVALRTELDGPDGRLVHEAVRLEADADVPDDVFELPAGVDLRPAATASR